MEKSTGYKVNLSSADSSELPLETATLRRLLAAFLDTSVKDPITEAQIKIGSYKWGVYAFYDWDNEPIYVGQTCETLRTRIRRHLTNQRTDAVAMNVLDPFEVQSLKVWPIPDLQQTGSNAAAKARLNSLEYSVFCQAIKASKFTAILNEKEPLYRGPTEPIPNSYSGQLVSDQVRELRGHDDIRLARRAAVLSRLAQVIVERKVNRGLRKALLTQARRITWLAEQRLAGYASEDGSETSDQERSKDDSRE